MDVQEVAYIRTAQGYKEKWNPRRLEGRKLCSVLLLIGGVIFLGIVVVVLVVIFVFLIVVTFVFLIVVALVVLLFICLGLVFLLFLALSLIFHILRSILLPLFEVPNSTRAAIKYDCVSLL